MIYYNLVTYDLRNQRDYEKIKKGIDLVAIEWAKPLRSVFIIKTTLSPKETLRILRQHIDNDDGLMVIETKINSWASVRVKEVVTNKMQSWSIF